MEISIKLMGIFRDKTPEGGKLELADGTSIKEVLEGLGVPTDRVHVVSVNGDFHRDLDRALQSGDELTVVPPVSGGSQT